MVKTSDNFRVELGSYRESVLSQLPFNFLTDAKTSDVHDDLVLIVLMTCFWKAKYKKVLSEYIIKVKGKFFRKTKGAKKGRAFSCLCSLDEIGRWRWFPMRTRDQIPLEWKMHQKLVSPVGLHETEKWWKHGENPDFGANHLNPPIPSIGASGDRRMTEWSLP